MFKSRGLAEVSLDDEFLLLPDELGVWKLVFKFGEVGVALVVFLNVRDDKVGH